MEKIVQIIPAPADMWVKNEDNGDVFYTRVACLALVEEPDGYRYISAADITPADGCIELIGRSYEVTYSTTDPNNNEGA